jgi:Ca-activated chloride channel homolog
VKLHFQYEQFLFGLLALLFFLVLFISLLAWKKRTIRKIGDKQLVKALIKDYSARLFTTKFIVFSLAFAAGVLAIANLRKAGTSEGIMRQGIDLVIALDVSNSMYATDLPPTRLERAKQMIDQLITGLPNDRIGLVLFAGQAYLQMPLTTDHRATQLFVSAANPASIPSQGTVIAEAMDKSADAFNTMEGRFKSVLLISDGEDHDPDALDKAAELAEKGIMVNTVGVGSTEGSPIYDPITGEEKKDATGNTVITKLNEEELKQIAEATNGAYTRLQGSTETVEAILAHLSQIDKKAFADVSLTDFKTYYGWFAGVMFLLLLAEFFIPESKRRAT